MPLEARRSTPCLPPRQFGDGLCLCGKPLPRRRDGLVSPWRVWCTPACSDAISRRHHWGSARHAALMRVGYHYDTSTSGPERVFLGYRCERCSRFTTEPEVNHKIPLRGQYRAWTCLNHEDNLEVVCRGCHRAITRAQRRGQISA